MKKTNEIVKPSLQIEHLKKEKFVQIYRQLMGHISDTCSTVGISRTTYYNWLDSDINFAKEIMECEMELNDDVRDVLVKKAGEGDMTAVIFYLKNRHPDFKQQPTTLIQQNFNTVLDKEKKEFDL